MIRTVVIDDEPVRLVCARLSVRDYGTIARLAGERGAAPVGRDFIERLPYIDTYVRVVAGDLVVDERVVTDGITFWFASRDDVLAQLFDALLSAQQPNADERRQLETAARFSDWLERAKQEDSASQWVKTGTSCAECHRLKLCARRGCDGRDTKKPVWHDKKLVLRQCPVLSFTPDVEETLRLFYWSHELASTGQHLQWRQTHLLTSGAVEDQDAWLTGAFGWLRSVHAQLLQDAMNETKRAHGRTKR